MGEMRRKRSCPANRVERTRTNMSVGHAMKPMSEAHFASLRRHMVEVIGIQVGQRGRVLPAD